MLFCIENSVTFAKEAYDAGREPVSKLLPMVTTCSDVFRAEYELGSPPVSMLWSSASCREGGGRDVGGVRWAVRRERGERRILSPFSPAPQAANVRRTLFSFFSEEYDAGSEPLSMFVSSSRFAREVSLDQEEGKEPERELSYLDGDVGSGGRGDDRGKKGGEAVRKREKE